MWESCELECTVTSANLLQPSNHHITAALTVSPEGTQREQAQDAGPVAEVHTEGMVSKQLRYEYTKEYYPAIKKKKSGMMPFAETYEWT